MPTSTAWCSRPQALDFDDHRAGQVKLTYFVLGHGPGPRPSDVARATPGERRLHGPRQILAPHVIHIPTCIRLGIGSIQILTRTAGGSRGLPRSPDCIAT